MAGLNLPLLVKYIMELFEESVFEIAKILKYIKLNFLLASDYNGNFDIAENEGISSNKVKYSITNTLKIIAKNIPEAAVDLESYVVVGVFVADS